MMTIKGFLRSFVLLILIVPLVLPAGTAGADWPGALSREFDRVVYGEGSADIAPTHPYSGGMRSTDSSLTDVHTTAGPHTWQGSELHRIDRADLQAMAVEVRAPDQPAGTCTVTSTADSGAGTLRQCMLDAVAGDEILFSTSTFPPSSPATIAVSSMLPMITVDNLTIDASNAGVILDGSSVTEYQYGFVLNDVQGVTIRGLQIENFNMGILIAWESTNNTIGGDRATGAGPMGQGNRISGNSYAGIQVQDAGTSNNTIIGNFIGTNLAGSSADGNELAGIIIGWGASQNTIGGTRSTSACDADCNLISGNDYYGVLIENDDNYGTDGNQVMGNFIGTNLSGSASLPNYDGVILGLGATDSIIGGEAAGEGNLISGNTQRGVWISDARTTGSQVLGNIIGADISGTSSIPNILGIIIAQSADTDIGGSAPGAGNLISGNEDTGIRMEYLGAPGNTIAGNGIGTNLNGTAALTNTFGIVMVGVSDSLIGGTDSGAGNLISGNVQKGIHFGDVSSQNQVQGNTIGTNAAGDAIIANGTYGVFLGFGAHDNTIGGSASGAGNLISGNYEAGIFIQNAESTGNHILGNRIGTNRSGDSALPNGYGISVVAAQNTVIGGADTSTPWVCDGPCNLVSGNNIDGVSIQGTSAGLRQLAVQDSETRLVQTVQSNQVMGNFIGTNLAGTSAIPNLAGVDLSFQAEGNQIGGYSNLGEGNLISGNHQPVPDAAGGEGVVIRHTLTTSNTVSGNRIGTTANGSAALPNEANGIWITEGASGNIIGGEAAGMGNLISGQDTNQDHLDFGVYISTEYEPEATGNQVIGNRIGTNAAGTSAVPNGGGVGVANLVTGTVIRDNLISGNSLRGILLYGTTQHQIYNNDIGLAANGDTALRNEGYGIILYIAPDNLIGPGNTIAFNYFGVAIGEPESVGNTITQNSIYYNLHVQIGFFGVEQDLAPAPTLTAWDGAVVSGTACSGCQVEVFSNTGSVPAGRQYLGTTTAAGDGSFNLNIGSGYRYLAATATDAEGTTSGFSNSLFIGTEYFVHFPLIQH